jgi:glutamate dehydrogenase
VATVLTNNIINRVRPTLVHQLTEETGKPPADVARAFTVMRDVFDLRTLWAEIEALDNKLPAKVQLDMLQEVGRLLERAMQWLLRGTYEKLDAAATVAEFRPKIEAIAGKLHAILPSQVLALLKARQGELEADGIPERLAYRVASLGVMSAALDIVRIARGGHNVEEVAGVYFGLGARFGLDRIRSSGAGIAVDTPWQKAAVVAVLDDLFNYQSTLASRVIAESDGAKEPVESWLAARPRIVERIDQTMNDLRNAQSVDLAMLTVASRQLRALVES